MSGAAISNENAMQSAFPNNERESAVHGSSQVPDISPPATETVIENDMLLHMQAAATSPNGQQVQPENSLNEILLKQIELLQLLTRELSENEPKPTSSDDKETKGSHRKFFGLNKSETGPEVNNRSNYEQKYHADRPGEELSPHARVWLTYLDEAGTYDRERVEGWKDSTDVLLVFAGLFSAVVTTFVSLASQSLQQDNTLVSASLLFDISQLLRAQLSGTPINNIPSSTLTPTSLFTPSTNALLVNGLWFTSLAITLSTALFATLSKQWLHYYLSSTSGTPLEKAKARQFRFEGFELWKVGAIVDLLPILLHLAVGLFLTGIIILLFPLDVRIAWTIVAITGVTYVLYFVSVILPIWYPGCPYTTSLTIYIGVLFFSLPKIFHWIRAVLYPETEQVTQPDSGLKPEKDSGAKGSIVSTIPTFTNWREEKIKEAVTRVDTLDVEAIHWLYETSSASRSVHRIVARCVFMHQKVTQRFKLDILDNFWRIPEVNKPKTLDIHHGLYVDLLSHDEKCNYWSTPDEDLKRKLSSKEYRNYSRIAKHVVDRKYDQILTDAIPDDLKLPPVKPPVEPPVKVELPPVMWQCFFAKASGDATVAAQVLTSGQIDLFHWKSDPNPDSKPRTDVLLWSALKDIVISHKWKFWNSDSKPDSNSDSDSTLDSTLTTDPKTLETVLEEFGESRKWKFDYLFRYLRHGSNPDYSLDKAFETRYLLLVSVYQDLTSDQSQSQPQPLVADKEKRQQSLSSPLPTDPTPNKPLINIPDKEQRQQFLSNLFIKFDDWFHSKPSEPRVLPKQYFTFFRDICCADAFWCEDMTDDGRKAAVKCLSSIWESIDTDAAKRSFPFTKYLDPSSIKQWCSRDLDNSNLPQCIFTLLFVPRNRDNLSTLLLNDPNAVSCLSNSVRILLNSRTSRSAEEHILSNLMHLLESVNPGAPLFTTLYDTSVLVQLWKFLVLKRWDAEEFFVTVQSKLDRKKLDELHAAMKERAPARSGEDLDDVDHASYPRLDKDVHVLAASAREFEKSLKMPSQPQTSVKNQSTGEKNHDSEERAQPEEPNGNERRNNSIVHRMNKAFPFGQR